MKRIVMGLTVSAIDKLVTNSIAFSKAKSNIFQHKILLSDTIMLEYEKHFEEDDQLELFRNWFIEINRTDSVEFNKDTVSTIFMEELFTLQKRYSHHIIICYDESFDRDKDICFISLDEIDSNNNENELVRYCIPYNSFIRMGSSLLDFEYWLKLWLESENNIRIVDPYICKSKNKDLLCKSLLPQVPASAKIHIYYDERYADHSIISSIKAQYGSRVKMHSSNPDDLHDRFIICDTFYITIGIGLDVFDYSKKKARKETSIAVSNGIPPSTPRPSLKNVCYRR